ncbi:methyltransferase LaeA [Lineolata rhizophorae]|uniref:Methyltransferase LaeA n=1 Tax=Lineolata rhizophorae TaxID=578093 RepID=A0A6A6P2Z9_9PEZI|nr:methyltransferase LaeA [Lineolata rhizophorae]
MKANAGPMLTMTSNGVPVPLPQNYLENGRLYHGFRRGIYLFPCDEAEKDRMDIYHKLFLVARREQLHQAPITRVPWDHNRILDLGCGTGIWAIDMADKYQEAEVVGLDLVNIQPEKIPPNLRFRIPRDIEGPWSLGEDSWDMIHLRMACGSITSWPELYQKIFLHLKPGYGWIEQVEIDLEPRCDDQTLDPNSPLVQWYSYIADATARANRPIAYQHNTRQMLQQAGFIDIQETIVRCPINSWPADHHQKAIGRWYNIGLVEGLEALSLAPLCRMYGWTYPEHIKPFLEQVKAQLMSRKVHAYNNMHIWIARRPQQ